MMIVARAAAPKISGKNRSEISHLSARFLWVRTQKKEAGISPYLLVIPERTTTLSLMTGGSNQADTALSTLNSGIFLSGRTPAPYPLYQEKRYGRDRRGGLESPSSH
ncbi:MAG: hypothetical protein CMI27_06515 [Opitutae bacterium]|nr:hypothetical protein [Opitutae bacterium]